MLLTAWTGARVYWGGRVLVLLSWYWSRLYRLNYLFHTFYFVPVWVTVWISSATRGLMLIQQNKFNWINNRSGVAEVYGHFGPKTLRTQDISAHQCRNVLGHFDLRSRPPKFGAHSPNVGRPVDGRWRWQHPAASVVTNVVSSLLNAVAVLCFRTYYVRCRQWVTDHSLLVVC